jgi:hypothetical protein
MWGKGVQITRIQWWKLKGKSHQTFREGLITEGTCDQNGGPDSMWVNMTTCIRKVAMEMLGVTKSKKMNLIKDT